MLANTPRELRARPLDYVVTKMPRFAFDKFAGASNKLGTQMKATGEVMAVGRTIEESLLKAVRSLEIGACHLYLPKFHHMPIERLLDYIKDGTDDRIFAIAQLMWLGVDYNRISNLTGIDLLFLDKIHNIVELERRDKGRAGKPRKPPPRQAHGLFRRAPRPTSGSAPSGRSLRSAASSASSPSTR